MCDEEGDDDDDDHHVMPRGVLPEPYSSACLHPNAEKDIKEGGSGGGWHMVT